MSDEKHDNTENLANGERERAKICESRILRAWWCCFSHYSFVSRRSSHWPTMLAVTLVVFVLVLVVKLLHQRWKQLQFFKERGIPGPEPHLLWGHYLELRSDHFYWTNKWAAEYGETYGLFWGTKPFLVTRNLDIAREVLTKQFSKFINRGKQFALEDTHPLAKEMVAFIDDVPWKQIRSALSPAFSSKKIREMTPLILQSIRDFEDNLNKFSSQEKPFDVYPMLKRFTVDNIGRTIFGINANTQVEAEVTSPLLRAALAAVRNLMSTNMDLICNCFESVNEIFGFALKFLLRFHILPHAISDMDVEMRKIVAARQKSPPQNDLLQSLLESQEVNADVNALAARGDTTENEKNSLRTRNTQLTTDQVVGNAIQMFLAGYETTSTALGFIFHCLGKYPDVQQRLREEIEEALEGKAEPTYEVAMNLKYMDQVIRESLRILPPVTGFTTRRCVTDVEICGTKYPAGLTFYFPTKQIHIDPEHWDDPLTFNPDRFSQPLKNPLAYQPFGDGPRNCIGMRPALLMLKLTLCKIVPKFEFKSTEDPVVRGVMIVSQPDTINVTVKSIKKSA